jgi:hypothetical protein
MSNSFDDLDFSVFNTEKKQIIKEIVTAPVGDKMGVADLHNAILKDISHNSSYISHLKDKLKSSDIDCPQDLFISICMYINTYGNIRKVKHLNAQVKAELVSKLKQYGFTLTLPLTNETYDPLRFSLRKRT